MGAGSAVLSKSLRNLEADKELTFQEFQDFMGTHFRPEHADVFAQLAEQNANASRSPKTAGKRISVAQLQEALEDRFVAAKLWRQFKKTWDGGPNWDVVKQLLKQRPSAIRVLDVSTKTVEGLPGTGEEFLIENSQSDGRDRTSQAEAESKSKVSPKQRGGKQKLCREVTVKRTMLDVAVEFAVTREYRLDLNVLSLMHECWPGLILQRNMDGDNPLHVAVNTWPRSPTDVAVSLVEICPQAARERDGNGRRPLAAALEKGTADELVMALAMADADSVFEEEVQKADRRYGSRLEHILRSGQIEARRELELSILEALQYPKAMWIRLGNDFDVKAVVEDKCDDWRIAAEAETAETTKGVFLPPLQKAKTLKTFLKCAELAFVGPQLQGEFTKRYVHDFLSPLLEAGRGFLEDEIKWADGHHLLLKQVFDVLRLRLAKLEWKTREVVSNRDNFRPYDKRPGFQDLLQKANYIHLHSDVVENDAPFVQLATDIPTLYLHAFQCYPRMEALIEDLAVMAQCHKHLSPLKSLYRVLERTAFVDPFGEGIPPQWDCSIVCDVVRAVLEFKGEDALERMLTCLDKLFERDNIQIVFLDEHFDSATEGGWFDIKVYVTFLDDPNRHICEIQLLEESIKTIRKSLGTIGDVEEFKAAKELLIATGHRDLVDSPAPQQKVPKGKSTEHRLLLETVDALMMEARAKTKLLTAAKTVIQEKERVITLRDQEVAQLQRELTKMKKKNEALLASRSRPGSAIQASRSKADESEFAKETHRKAAAISLGRSSAPLGEHENQRSESPVQGK